METETVVHDWRIAEREYERHEARRGRRHAFETVEPQRTVLVVIDMVPFFLLESAYARGIVANINHLAGSLRAAGGTVAWVLPRRRPPSAKSVEFLGKETAEMFAASADPGPLPERLWPALQTHDDDLWAEKSAASAFFPGRSPLPGLLAARGIDTVVIAGTVTSVCCESSARDASTLRYRVIFLADGTADVNDDVHNAALRTIYRTFGDVRSTDDVVQLISDAERERASES